MKKNELQKIRIKKTGEFKKMADKKKMELAKAIVERGAGREKNPKKAKNIRRDIAQILTILKEKELLEQEKK